MSEERLRLYLDRMQTAATRALTYVEDMDQILFSADQRTQDAVVANIAAIGECAGKIMDIFPDFVALHAEIEWRDIRAMRNRVAHQYFELDVDTVWRTAKVKIPQLLSELDAIRHWRAQGE